MTRQNLSASFDRSLVVAFILILIFDTPLVDLWSRAGSPWYLPYLLWFVLILLGSWIHWRDRDK